MVGNLPDGLQIKSMHSDVIYLYLTNSFVTDLYLTNVYVMNDVWRAISKDRNFLPWHLSPSDNISLLHMLPTSGELKSASGSG